MRQVSLVFTKSRCPAAPSVDSHYEVGQRMNLPRVEVRDHQVVGHIPTMADVREEKVWMGVLKLTMSAVVCRDGPDRDRQRCAMALTKRPTMREQRRLTAGEKVWWTRSHHGAITVTGVLTWLTWLHSLAGINAIASRSSRPGRGVTRAGAVAAASRLHREHMCCGDGVDDGETFWAQHRTAVQLPRRRRAGWTGCVLRRRRVEGS